MNKRTIRRGLLLTSALAALALAGAPQAVAQTTGSASEAAAFDIPAQPLSDALVAYSDATGLQLFFDAGLARGKTSPGARGVLGREEALGRILAESGLTYSIDGNAATIAQAEAPPPAAAGSLVLGTINVSGEGGRLPAAVVAPYERAGSSARITDKDIQRIAPMSTGDIFKTVPGVIAADNRNSVAVDVNIRGMQGMGRNAVLIDGTQQNNSMYLGYKGSRDRVYVDPDLLAGVDVEKGPSSGEFGAGVIGGVVNMRTLDAADVVQEGERYGFRARAGAVNNTVEPEVRRVVRGPYGDTGALRNDGPDVFDGSSLTGSFVGALFDDRYEVVGAVARRKVGNYFAGKNGATEIERRWATPMQTQSSQVVPLSPYKPGDEVANTSQDSFSGLVKGRLKFGDGQALELGYTYYDNKYGEAADISVMMGDLGDRHPSRVTTNTVTSRFVWKPEANPLIDFHAGLWAADARNRSPNNMNVPLNPTLTPPPEVDTTSRVKSVGGDIWNRSTFGGVLGGLSLKYGGQYFIEQVDSQTTYGFGFGLNDMNGERAVGGLFVQAALDVTDWLKVEAGARYDGYRASDTRDVATRWADMSDEGFSPSVSVTVTPVAGVQVYGLYAEGWRPSSLRELMYLQWASDTRMNNIKPEIAKNYEVGVNFVRQDLLLAGDTFLAKVAYFDNKTEDYLARIGGSMVSYNFYNIQSVQYKGLELSLRYDSSRLFGQLGVSHYLDAEYCMPNFDPGPQFCNAHVKGADYGAPYIPPEISANLTVGGRMFQERLEAGFRVSYADRKMALVRHNFSPDTQWRPYTVLDLFGSWDFTDKLTLDVSAENLLDQYYLDALSRTQKPSPGRTVRATLTARF